MIRVQGIETWWRQYFPHALRLALGLTQSPVKQVPVLLRGSEATCDGNTRGQSRCM